MVVVDKKRVWWKMFSMRERDNMIKSVGWGGVTFEGMDGGKAR